MAETDPIDELEGGGRAKAARLLFVSLIVLLVGGFFVYNDMTRIRTFILENGALGIVFSVLIYGVLGATLVPSEPITVLVGAVFGPWIATLVATIGNLLAALVEYYIGRGLRDASSFAARRERLPFGLGKLPVSSPAFLILGRMVPGAGPKLVSVLGGLYHVPLARYLWTAAIPTAIGAAIFAFGGAGLFELLRFHPTSLP
jgi:uncharacterized membrane protein YdjX (TVP38/TMEM64 family)